MIYLINCYDEVTVLVDKRIATEIVYLNFSKACDGLS